MISSIISRLVILLFGTLYPAYASYKAVKTKNVREYVKWMMYWIVFALFTCAETFTDVFLSWFPFYYEIKIILVIWLLSPATKGSSILYRKFVHPMLSSREQEIDEYISKAKEQSYKQVLDLGSKGVNALMQTAIKSGGGLVNQIRKSYSLSDLSEQRHEREYDGNEETDSLGEPRVVRRRHSPRRHSPRRHTTTSAIYFSEIDVRHDVLGNIPCVEDISSGYSSGEIVHAGQTLKIQGREGLVRTGSIGSTKLKPTRVTRSTVPKKSAEDLEHSLEYSTDTKENFIYLNDKPQLLHNMDNHGQKTKMSESSSSEEEFRDCIEHDGNVNLSSSNMLNFPQTLDAESKIVMHENLEHSVQPIISVFLKDSEISKEFSEIQNEDLNLEVKSSCDCISNEDCKMKETENQNENHTCVEKNNFTERKDMKTDVRGGKYNKPVAPLPPSEKKFLDFDLSAIKATLVLKPGVVKSVGAEEFKNEIFCHSPKLKRRSLNVSTSNSTTTSSDLPKSPNRSKSRLDASLSRLKMLPKKINFWHKDDSVIDQKKRTSWYDTLEVPELSKEFSKSDDDISKLRAKEKLMRKIKSLTEEEKEKLEN